MKPQDIIGEATLDSIIPTSDKQLREALFFVYRGECFYTGRKLDPKTFHIDHIFPKKEGGIDCISNYVPTLQSINILKSNRHNGSFHKIVSEVVNLLYADRVLTVYNDLKWNGVGMILVGDFLRQKQVKRKQTICNRFKSRLSTLYRVKRSPKRYLYRKEDLEQLLMICSQTDRDMEKVS